MGCDYYKMPDGEPGEFQKSNRRVRPDLDLITDWEIRDLPARKLREKTCKKWKYGIAKRNGKTVQVANYIRDGQVVAQKIR